MVGKSQQSPSHTCLAALDQPAIGLKAKQKPKALPELAVATADNRSGRIRLLAPPTSFKPSPPGHPRRLASPPAWSSWQCPAPGALKQTPCKWLGPQPRSSAACFETSLTPAAAASPGFPPTRSQPPPPSPSLAAPWSHWPLPEPLVTSVLRAPHTPQAFPSSLLHLVDVLLRWQWLHAPRPRSHHASAERHQARRPFGVSELSPISLKQGLQAADSTSRPPGPPFALPVIRIQ